MNKPSKCKNCQWYGRPYWSIINPCDNCPNENNYETKITIYGEPVFKETLMEEQIKKAMTNKSIFKITIEEKAKEKIRRMIMEEYKERFIKEYKELKERYEKLHNIIVKAEANTLDFELSCPLDLLKEQANYMGNYLHILEIRAEIEKVDING